MGGELVHRTVQTNGINMHIAEQGEGPLVLLLHGFPELWFSWRKQITALANHGYHAVAPDMRGYGDTDSPPDFTSYSAFHLVGDIIGLLDQLGEKQAFVVGHDWGAFVAWSLCLFRPDRVRALVNLCVPFILRSPEKPVPTFRQAFGEGFYVLQFQEPGRAEKSFARHDCLTIMKKFLLINKSDLLIAPSGKEIIDTLDFPSSLPSWITEEELKYFASKFEKSGFTGGLNYYRVCDLNWELLAPWQGAKITVPTKFIAAAKDIGFEGYKIKDYILGGAMKKLVPNLEAVIIDGHHFIQQEKAQEVNDEILSFFGSPVLNGGDALKDPFWKLICADDLDGSSGVFILILVKVTRLAKFVWLEKWMTESSWEDLHRAHVRRDKACLFIGFTWFFGEGSSASYLRRL